MFKWGRTKDKIPYEPKTPKMPSVSLPDERYTPIESHIAYLEKPRAHTTRRTSHDYRGTTPMLDSWASPPAVSGRSRSRTISTPVRDVKAPRPIRPHPSQGGFIPVMEPTDRIRRDHSRGPLQPVGVPSAAYLEEQIRHNRSDTRTAPPPHLPIDMLRNESYRSTAEEERLREVAKRLGARVTTQPSKAYIEELNAQQARENLSRRPSPQSTKKKHIESSADGHKGKELVDFENWKAVPLEMENYKPVPVDPYAPLKPALKKTSSLQPTPPKPMLKSALKKTDSSPESAKSYYSENESSRRPKHDGEWLLTYTLPVSQWLSSDRIKPPRVAHEPSKAFLEEQKEKLEKIKQRGWASHHPSQVARPMHDIRPTAFGHSNSSSTGSPTDSVLVTYDQRGRPVRSRRSSFADPNVVPSNYIPAYIKDAPSFAPHAHTPRPVVGPSEHMYHGILSWPMVEYALRKRQPYPLVSFDAGFDPRDRRYPVKANRGLHSSPLTREEMDIPVVHGLHLPEMVIICQKLKLWPIHLKNPNDWHALRVIDVFRAIYDTFAQPLTPHELSQFGDEYIRRCQPAFMRRCEDSPQFTHVEERRGLLRIDLLRGHRIFKGLVPMLGRPFTYELLFDDGH